MNPKLMKNEKNHSLDLTNVSDLMEKQSVRATFKLSTELIETLRILSSQLGIKQKSLFDLLLEDTVSLNEIAERTKPDQLDKKNRVQKTFVISRKSVTTLDRISKQYDMPRDDLVEYSIQRLFPILLEERRKQLSREKAFIKIVDHFSRGNQMLDEIRNLLGKEDPIYKSVDSILSLYDDVHKYIENFIKKGKKIADLSVDKFNQL